MRRAWLAVGVMALASAAWFLTHLETVPPYPDEAYHAVAGSTLARGTLPSSIILFPLGGGRLPWMSNEHTGLPDPYVFFPFWRWLGVSLRTLRLIETLGALAAMLLWTKAVDVWFGRRSAVAAAALFFFYAPFVLSSVIGLTNDLPLLWILHACFLWALGNWRLSRKTKPLAVAAFLAGVGCWAKLVFALYLLPGATYWLLETRGSRDRLRQGAWALAAFASGAAPLIIYNLYTIGRAGQTLVIAWTAMTRGTSLHIENHRFFEHFALRARQLHWILTYEKISTIEFTTPFQARPRLGLYGYAVAAPAVVAAWKRPPRSREWRFWAASYLFALLGLCFTLTRFDLRQMIWPLPLLAALSAHALASSIKRDGALAAALAMLLWPSAWILGTFETLVAAGSWSGARPFVEAARYLREHRIDAPLLVMDTADEQMLFVLSGGRVEPTNVMHALYLADPAERARFVETMLDRCHGNVLVESYGETFSPDYRDQMSLFAAALRRHRSKEEARFDQPGNPLALSLQKLPRR